MRKFSQHLVSFLKNEDGPTAVEYAVMLALIIVVCITAITTLGTNANNTFSYVGHRGRLDRLLSRMRNRQCVRLEILPGFSPQQRRGINA